MRGFITRKQLTKSSASWRSQKQIIHRVGHGVYVEGDPPTAMELAVGRLHGQVLHTTVAGALYGLDSVQPRITPPRRFIDEEHVVYFNGYLITDGLQTLRDLATMLDDLEWEQALESALFKKLLKVTDFEAALEQRRVGNERIRRVLALRPEGAPPTESMLETLGVQMLRKYGLPDPLRQLDMPDIHARIDLCWPDFGTFLELDGQHHEGQPVYDADRQNRIVIKTGWHPLRLTWTQVTRIPRTSAGRVAELLNVTPPRHD